MTALSAAPAKYDPREEQENRNELGRRDDNYHKKNAHIEVGKDQGVIFKDTVTGTRYLVRVTSGALALTAL